MFSRGSATVGKLKIKGLSRRSSKLPPVAFFSLLETFAIRKLMARESKGRRNKKKLYLRIPEETITVRSLNKGHAQRGFERSPLRSVTKSPSLFSTTTNGVLRVNVSRWKRTRPIVKVDFAAADDDNRFGSRRGMIRWSDTSARECDGSVAFAKKTRGSQLRRFLVDVPLDSRGMKRTQTFVSLPNVTLSASK